MIPKGHTHISACIHSFSAPRLHPVCANAKPQALKTFKLFSIQILNMIPLGRHERKSFLWQDNVGKHFTNLSDKMVLIWSIFMHYLCQYVFASVTHSVCGFINTTLPAELNGSSSHQEVACYSLQVIHWRQMMVSSM